MKLVIKELTDTPIEQAMVPNKNTNVIAIRPHIVRYNFPTGTLHLEVYDSDENLIATSETVNIEDIGIEDYCHGFLRFNINCYLKANEEYTLKLVGGGEYTFEESAYCAWVNSYNLAKYPIKDGIDPASIYRYPFNFEVWKRTER